MAYNNINLNWLVVPIGKVENASGMHRGALASSEAPAIEDATCNCSTAHNEAEHV